MEKIIATANKRKWHQTEGGSQLVSKAFVEKIGNYGEVPEVKNILDSTFIAPT